MGGDTDLLDPRTLPLARIVRTRDNSHTETHTHIAASQIACMLETVHMCVCLYVAAPSPVPLYDVCCLQTDVSVYMSGGDVAASLTALQESGRLPELRDDTTVADQLKALAWDTLNVRVYRCTATVLQLYFRCTAPVLQLYCGWSAQREPCGCASGICQSKTKSITCHPANRGLIPLSCLLLLSKMPAWSH
jgi:hypothetical protein